MSVTIREKTSGTPLAQGEPGTDFLTHEGNLYARPECVAEDALTVTARTYTCPYKGTCHWVDFTPADGPAVKDVAWVYAEPKPATRPSRADTDSMPGRAARPSRIDPELSPQRTRRTRRGIRRGQVSRLAELSHSRIVFPPRSLRPLR